MKKMRIVVQSVLAIVIIVLAYMLYDSVASRVEFYDTLDKRKKVVIERLVKLRDVQNAFKIAKKRYAGSCDEIMQFILQDSIPLVKIDGTVPDTLTESEALKLGILKKDTILISVKDTLFGSQPFDSICYVPFSQNIKFDFKNGEVEKSGVKVPVFEISTPYKSFIWDLDYTSNDFDANALIKVGSLEEPSTSGNWE